MCILCHDFWMCHAILGSTFRNKTTSKLRPLTTVPRVVVFVRFYCTYMTLQQPSSPSLLTALTSHIYHYRICHSSSTSSLLMPLFTLTHSLLTLFTPSQSSHTHTHLVKQQTWCESTQYLSECSVDLRGLEGGQERTARVDITNLQTAWDHDSYQTAWDHDSYQTVWDHDTVKFYQLEPSFPVKILIIHKL